MRRRGFVGFRNGKLLGQCLPAKDPIGSESVAFVDKPLVESLRIVSGYVSGYVKFLLPGSIVAFYLTVEFKRYGR